MFTFNPLVIISLTTGLLYIGPESVMPLATVVAAVIGVILILWRYVISFIKKAYHKVLRKPLPEPITLDLDVDEDLIAQDKPAGPEA